MKASKISKDRSKKAKNSKIFLQKETGFRQYRETMFLVGRKNGKSTLLFGIALYMMIADKDDTLLPVLYGLDSQDEWTDPAKREKANPGLGTIKQYKPLATLSSL